MLVDAASGSKERWDQRDHRLHQVPLSQLMRPALLTSVPLMVWPPQFAVTFFEPRNCPRAVCPLSLVKLRVFRFCWIEQAIE